VNPFAKTVASTASAIAPPTCCTVLSTAEPTPESSARTRLTAEAIFAAGYPDQPLVVEPDLREQELGDRLADEVRTADDDRLETGEVAELVLEQHQAAEGGAGHQARLSNRQPAGVDRVKAVHVLGRVDRGDHRLRVDLGRKRELDEDAVDARIFVERPDERDQCILLGSRGKPVLEAFHPRLERRFALGADVDLARRVLTHQHDRETGLAPRFLLEPRGGLGDARP